MKEMLLLIDMIPQYHTSRRLFQFIKVIQMLFLPRILPNSRDGSYQRLKMPSFNSPKISAS